MPSPYVNVTKEVIMWFVNERRGIRVFVTAETTEEELEAWLRENHEDIAWEIDIFQTTECCCQKEDDEIRFWGDDGIFALEKEEE